ncbi:hypothetical protein M405DRAFT_481366 [Rhizopogon salebrosus TDB-379]|nr:hypothetical protein M405DRAFT_481366 [Rhizopogon salebrosus TDB-379]
MPPSLACSWLLKSLKNMRWHHTQTLSSSLMAQNMQRSTSQQKSPSSPVIDDYHGVSDVPSSPTIISPDDPSTIPHIKSNRTLVLCFDGTGDQVIVPRSLTASIS